VRELRGALRTLLVLLLLLLLAPSLLLLLRLLLLLPGRTDMYFPPDDNALDVPHMARAELRPIPSIWGHVAGAPDNNPPDLAYIRHAVLDWLDRAV